MDCHPTNWLPQSFTRSPHWRMLRASYRVQEHIAFDPRIDDEWVEVALCLIVADCEGIPPEACAAFELWNADKHARWLLEARLLTAQSFDEIAATCEIAVAVVSAYHELFFDVQHRLEARDWVLTQAVCSHPMNDFAGAQPAGLWRYMAFMGGPFVLDAVAAVTMNRPLPERLRKTFKRNPDLEEKRLRLKTKLAIAALTAKAACKLGSLVELSEELDELDSVAAPERDAGVPLTPAVGEFIVMLNRLDPGEKTTAKRACTSASRKSRRRRSAVPVPSSPTTGGDLRE